ncbi:MAG: recombinase family protein, partial [Novosphingobium sp.]
MPVPAAAPRHRCAIYARFSSDHQKDTSVDDQLRDCQRFAEAKGWDVAEVFSDAAISGARNRRPGLTALLSAVAEGRFDVVLAEDQDRLARDQEDIAAIYKRVVFAGARIVTLAAGELNELHIGLKGTMDALELKKMAEKIRRGQRGALSRGRVPGGLCYGYEVVRRLDARGELERGLRQVVPEQAAIVRRICEEYADGRSAKAICRDLNQEGVPSARGGQWRPSTIIGNRGRALGILHNPIYTGLLLYNRVRMLRDPESRNRISRPNPESEREAVRIDELRIIDDALWQRVQERRRSYAEQPLTRRRRPRHLLSGLLRCGVCGGSYSVYAAGRVACTAHRSGGLCDNGATIAIAEVQRRVLTGLRDRLLSAEAVSLLVREYHREREQHRRQRAASNRTRTKRLAQLQREIDRLVSALAQGAAGFDEIRSALAERTRERDRLNAEVADEGAETVIALHPRIAEAYRERVQQLIGGLRREEITDASSSGQIRALIHAIHVAPAEAGGCTIEVRTSLDAAVALATGSTARRAAVRSVSMVAE